MNQPSKSERAGSGPGVEANHRPTGSRWLKLIPGYCLAFAGLVWILHDFSLTELTRQLATMKWQYVAGAVFFDFAGYVCQAWRWKLLLKRFGDLPLRRATQALCAGLFVSEVLPLSMGELARSHLAARWLNAPFALVFSTVLVERLFDGLWIAVGIGLSVMFLPLPEDFLIAGDIFGAVVLLGTAALVCVILRRPGYGSSRIPGQKGVRHFLSQMAEGVYGIGFHWNSYLSFGLSLVFLLLQAVTLWLMLVGYGVRLSGWSVMAVLTLILIGTAAPGPPGNAGTWQLSCVLGLALFGIDKSVATGFSLVCYALLSLLLIVVGFIALSRSGTTLFRLRNAASDLDAD